MEKTTGATLLGENARYEVLISLQKGLSISQIATYRKVNRSSIYKILSSLMKKGLVSKDGYGVYTLTHKGTEGLHSLVGLRNNIRQHNLGIKINILESPRNWNLRRSEIRQLPYYNKTIKLNNNEQDIFNFGKLQIRTTSKSIILKMPTIYSKDWDDAMIQVMNILELTIPKLESLFKIKLIKDYKSNIKIISQEYAIIQDALARMYRGEGNRLYISDEEGKIWMITDFSFSNDETEFIDPNNAINDIDAIAPFFNDLRKNPIILSDLINHDKELEGIVTSFAKNQVKHQKVLDNIMVKSKNIDMIPLLFDEIEKLNKRLTDAGL